ncbi:DUF308 domain-containing protein [Methylocystis sp. WRRC1]|uniref:HdeD family acid-resistance protein n=1 Tax=Methylocystis sp. WRRC1 TaxID=1732014 RepID=UPI001D146605|nr:DUF308 domain-containing protein [Methylocystis sp. WRRC1]MCC3244578.1 DUF308 domain-containing protein [Methylocystis sp. WRRC1]
MSFSPFRRPTDIEAAIARLRSRWAWFVAFGAFAVALGLATLALANVATIFSVYLIALFVIMVGGSEIVLGVNAHIWSHRLPLILVGLLYVVAGSFMLANPLTGAAAFTLLLGAALLATGVARAVFGASLPEGPSVFIVLAGALTSVLGMIILFDWPDNSSYVLGLFLGVDLLFYGASWIGFGLLVRER